MVKHEVIAMGESIHHALELWKEDTLFALVLARVDEVVEAGSYVIVLLAVLLENESILLHDSADVGFVKRELIEFFISDTLRIFWIELLIEIADAETHSSEIVDVRQVLCEEVFKLKLADEAVFIVVAELEEDLHLVLVIVLAEKVDRVLDLIELNVTVLIEVEHPEQAVDEIRFLEEIDSVHDEARFECMVTRTRRGRLARRTETTQGFGSCSRSAPRPAPSDFR